MPATPKWGLPYPDLTDNADVPADLGALALACDAFAKSSSGTLASRPTSTPGTPGQADRFYMVRGDADPAQNGRLYRDYGTGWEEITRPLGTTATTAAAGNDSRLSDQRTPSDASTTATKLAAALADVLGVSTATVRRGKSSVDGIQALTANGAYNLAPTPDRIQNLVVPTGGGIIHVAARALVGKGDGAQADSVRVGLFLERNGGAATLIGSSWGNTSDGNRAGLEVYALGGFFPSRGGLVMTSPPDHQGHPPAEGTYGLACPFSSGAGGGAINANVGSLLPPFLPVEVSAGTYTLSMRYASTGSITNMTVELRRLYAKVEVF